MTRNIPIAAGLSPMVISSLPDRARARHMRDVVQSIRRSKESIAYIKSAYQGQEMPLHVWAYVRSCAKHIQAQGEALKSYIQEV